MRTNLSRLICAFAACVCLEPLQAAEAYQPTFMFLGDETNISEVIGAQREVRLQDALRRVLPNNYTLKVSKADMHLLQSRVSWRGGRSALNILEDLVYQSQFFSAVMNTQDKTFTVYRERFDPTHSFCEMALARSGFKPGCAGAVDAMDGLLKEVAPAKSESAPRIVSAPKAESVPKAEPAPKAVSAIPAVEPEAVKKPLVRIESEFLMSATAGQSVDSVLNTWARRFGWSKVYWDGPELVLEADLAIDGDSFESVLSRLINSLNHSLGVNLKADLYDLNKVILIREVKS